MQWRKTRVEMRQKECVTIEALATLGTIIYVSHVCVIRLTQNQNESKKLIAWLRYLKRLICSINLLLQDFDM